MIQGFLQGLMVGFSIAAPVGPIGLLCIQRTLAGGRIAGLVSGLGAATADAFYGAIAGFGVTFVSTFLVAQQAWIRLLGGLFLIFLGVRVLRSKPRGSSANPTNRRLVTDYASTLVLTLSNPLTIISFAAVFVGLGLVGGGRDYLTAGVLVAGVFSGSSLWWVILSASVGAFKQRFGTRAMSWVNRLSGAVIGIFGLLALASLLV